MSYILTPLFLSYSLGFYTNAVAFRTLIFMALMGSLQVGHDLSNFTFTLEKEMATHCSVLAWRIPGTGEPGGLPSVGLHRVGHD